MASLSNSSWQNQNQSTHNRDMTERAMCYVVREGVSDNLVREKLMIVNIHTYPFINQKINLQFELIQLVQSRQMTLFHKKDDYVQI